MRGAAAVLGEPLKLLFLSPFVWRPPAERSSQEAGEGLSFITLSPLPPVSPEGKKRGTTVWTSSWSGYTKPGSSLKGQNQTQPAGSTRRVLGVAMFPTAIRLESPLAGLSDLEWENNPISFYFRGW